MPWANFKINVGPECCRSAICQWYGVDREQRAKRLIDGPGQKEHGHARVL